MAAEKTVVKGMVNKDLRMDGKTVLITGANTGMGLAKSIDMARRGARVIMTARNMDKGNAAKNTVVKESGSENVIVKKLDLSSFESIRQFAADINENENRLHVLINNAGVMMCPKSQTKEGYEMQFGVNHLGHFLLTNLLLDLIKRSAPSRIITYSSGMHHKRFGGAIHWDDLNCEKDYSPSKAYAQSKLMNVLFSRELSKKLEGTGVTTYSVDPGAVKTDLQRHVGAASTFMDRLFTAVTFVSRPFWNTPEKGAQTAIYCAVVPELEKETGKFYESCKVANETEDAKNDEYARRLWDLSAEYTREKKPSAENKPAGEPEHAEDKPAVQPVHAENKPAVEPEQAENKPAVETEQAENEPAAEPEHAENKPAAEPERAENKPAVETEQAESTTEEQKEA